MADDPYNNALKRQGELRKELAEIDQFLLLYKRFSGTPNERTDALRIGGGRPSLAQLSLVDTAQKLGPADYANMAERLIRAAGKPLTRGDIADALKAQHVVFPTDDIARYLGTILWRNRERFINVPGLGYTVRGLMEPEYLNRIHEANAKSAEIPNDVRDILVSAAKMVAKGDAAAINLAPNSPIPPDLDRRLLHQAGEELGRELYEAEKIALRDAFKLEAIMALI